LAYLHVQNRSVPTVKNIDRGVQVRVLSEPAGDADEGRLVLAASAVHCATARAGLRGIGGIDLLEVERLIGQHRFDLMPAGIQDGAVQPALLGDAFKLRPLCHVLCAQPFDNDGAIGPRNIGCGSVRPILANAGLLGFDFGRTLNCLAMAVAATLTTGRDTLETLVLRVQTSNAFGQSVAGAVAQHQRNCNATVNANSTTDIERLTVNRATDADLPAQWRASDGDFTNAALNGACVAELNPTDLRQADAGPLGVQLLNADLAPGETEAVSGARFLKLGEAALTFEEATKGRVEVFHGSLLRGLGHGSDKIELGSKVFKLSRLRDVVEVVARRTLVLPPVIDALIKAQIPDKAAHTGKFQHRLMLFTRGFQSVCEAAKNHIKLDRSIPCNIQ